MSPENNRPDENPEKMSRRDELEALLPFYLNGTLEGEDLAAVEAWLTSDPAAMAALGEAEAEFSGTTAANEAIRPPADALSRFAKALDAKAGPARAAAALRAGAALGRLHGDPGGLRLGGGHRSRGARAGADGDGARRPRQTGRDRRHGSPEHALRAGHLQAGRPHRRHLRRAVRPGAVILSGPAAGGVFKIGIPAKTAADYDRIVGLIAAQPFADTVMAGRRPANGG